MLAPEPVFEKVCVAVRQAGVVAKAFQGKVQNEGKDVEGVSQNESDRVKAQRSAKTLIDEVVQDIVLMALLDEKDNIMLDAEEKTSLSKLFSSEGKEVSVVIDPIDGTLEYLEGEDNYSICVGVIEYGEVKLAVVYFPARDIAYVVAPDGKSYVYRSFSEEGNSVPEAVALPDTFKRTFLVNSRVPEDVSAPLRGEGFAVEDDQGNAAVALLSVLSGGACAYLCDYRQIRDILLGAVIGKARNGFAKDSDGKPLVWPQVGRVPRAVFGNLGCAERAQLIFLQND